MALSTKLYLFSLVLIYTVTTCLSQSICIGNDKFVVMVTKASWNAASAICTQSSGVLAVLNSEPVASELVEFIDASGIGELTSRGFWIGLHDKELEGSFQWADGTALTYTNWYSNMPDNSKNKDPCHGQDCVQLWKKPRAAPMWKWDDDYCNKKKEFFCQYKNQPECMV